MRGNKIQFTFLMTPDERSWLSDHADELDLSAGQVMRKIFRQYKSNVNKEGTLDENTEEHNHTR